jgi:hypothetical protein
MLQQRLEHWAFFSKKHTGEHLEKGVRLCVKHSFRKNKRITRVSIYYNSRLKHGFSSDPDGKLNFTKKQLQTFK